MRVVNALSPIRLPEGIHLNVPEAAYHADPAPTPSASAGVLKTLATRSPLHAWHKHPRLNPEYSGGGRSDAMDAGTILHALICGTPLPYDVEAFPDYRTNAAKEWRDGVISSGRIPILAHKIEPIYDVARGVRANIERMPEIAAAIESADKEATLIWRERGVLCRCRYDILPPASFGFTIDLKFTGLSAEPEQWGRTLIGSHLFQAALYPRAVQALRGDKPEFRFLVCETEPPYGVSIHAMDPELCDLAARKLNHALDRWRSCTEADDWPGYESRTHYQAAPAWALAQQEEAEFRASVGDEP